MSNMSVSSIMESLNPFVRLQKSYRAKGRARGLTGLEAVKEMSVQESVSTQSDEASYTLEQLSDSKEKLVWVNINNLNETAVPHNEVKAWLETQKESGQTLTVDHDDSDIKVVGNYEYTRYEEETGKLYATVEVTHPEISTFSNLKIQVDKAKSEGYEARVGFSPKFGFESVRVDKQGQVWYEGTQPINLTITTTPSAIQTLGEKAEAVTEIMNEPVQEPVQPAKETPADEPKEEPKSIGPVTEENIKSMIESAQTTLKTEIKELLEIMQIQNETIQKLNQKTEDLKRQSISNNKSPKLNIL